MLQRTPNAKFLFPLFDWLLATFSNALQLTISPNSIPTASERNGQVDNGLLFLLRWCCPHLLQHLLNDDELQTNKMNTKNSPNYLCAMIFCKRLLLFVKQSILQRMDIFAVRQYESNHLKTEKKVNVHCSGFLILVWHRFPMFSILYISNLNYFYKCPTLLTLSKELYKQKIENFL